eukprot:scaffold13166_cov114-Isochrysis_galbana.AAC.8
MPTAKNASARCPSSAVSADPGRSTHRPMRRGAAAVTKPRNVSRMAVLCQGREGRRRGGGGVEMASTRRVHSKHEARSQQEFTAGTRRVHGEDGGSITTMCECSRSRA